MKNRKAQYTEPVPTNAVPFINCSIEVSQLPLDVFLRVGDGQKFMLKCRHRKALLQALASHANKDGTSCYPSRETLQKDTGFSDGTIDGYLRDLESEELIFVVKGGYAWEDGPRVRRLVIPLPVPRDLAGTQDSFTSDESSSGSGTQDSKAGTQDLDFRNSGFGKQELRIGKSRNSVQTENNPPVVDPPESNPPESNPPESNPDYSNHGLQEEKAMLPEPKIVPSEDEDIWGPSYCEEYDPSILNDEEPEATVSEDESGNEVQLAVGCNEGDSNNQATVVLEEKSSRPALFTGIGVPPDDQCALDDIEPPSEEMIKAIDSFAQWAAKEFQGQIIITDEDKHAILDLLNADDEVPVVKKALQTLAAGFKRDLAIYGAVSVTDGIYTELAAILNSRRIENDLWKRKKTRVRFSVV